MAEPPRAEAPPPKLLPPACERCVVSDAGDATARGGGWQSPPPGLRWRVASLGVRTVDSGNASPVPTMSYVTPDPEAPASLLPHPPTLPPPSLLQSRPVLAAPALCDRCGESVDESPRHCSIPAPAPLPRRPSPEAAPPPSPTDTEAEAEAERCCDCDRSEDWDDRPRSRHVAPGERAGLVRRRGGIVAWKRTAPPPWYGDGTRHLVAPSGARARAHTRTKKKEKRRSTMRAEV